MTRLCQPSSQLFQYVDKSGCSAAWGYGGEPGAIFPAGAWQTRSRTGLTFTELREDLGVAGPIGSGTRRADLY